MAKFLVEGVDAESGMETELIVEASSRANARAKAELKGMKVTTINGEDANAAPVVAAPVHPAPSMVIVQGRKVQTIEKTGKGWKLLSLIAALGFIVCLIGMVVSCNEMQAGGGPGTGSDAGGMTALWFLGVVLSLLLSVFARVGAWWFHG
jgi:hypothetical protein